MKRLIIPTMLLAGLAAALPAAAETVVLQNLQGIYSDDKEGGMKIPEGVACAADGTVVVADTGNARLLRYHFSGGSLSGGSEVKAPQLPYPLRLQLTSHGDILALDGRLRKIARIKPDGSFAGYLEPQGVPGGAVVPRSLRVGSGDSIYLLDIAGGRVVVLDATGTFQRQVTFPAAYGFMSDLALAPDGKLLLIDSVKARVYVAGAGEQTFRPLTGELHEYLDFPLSLETDAQGVIYVVDQSSGSIVLIGQDGAMLGRQLSRGWKPGLLNFPAQLCVTGNELMVADRGNNRVQVFERGR